MAKMSTKAVKANDERFDHAPPPLAPSPLRREAEQRSAIAERAEEAEEADRQILNVLHIGGTPSRSTAGSLYDIFAAKC